MKTVKLNAPFFYLNIFFMHNNNYCIKKCCEIFKKKTKQKDK